MSREGMSLLVELFVKPPFNLLSSTVENGSIFEMQDEQYQEFMEVLVMAPRL